MKERAKDIIDRVEMFGKDLVQSNPSRCNMLYNLDPSVNVA